MSNEKKKVLPIYLKIEINNEQVFLYDSETFFFF